MDLIQDWRNRQTSEAKKHGKLLQKLKKGKSKHLKAQADEIHETVFSKIDCLDCANCCKSIPPIVNKTDARRLAKHLGMKQGAFEKMYLHQDEDGDMVMNTSPCPFLEEDNKCLVYEYRPRACREYPHTDAAQFVDSIKLHKANTRVCPAVFHILESWAALTDR